MLVYDNWKFTFIWLFFFVLFVFVFEAESHVARLDLSPTYS